MVFDSEHCVQDVEGGAPAFVWTSRHTAALIVLCTAQALDGIDVTVVNAALPSIQHQLGLSSSALTWVINAYMILFGGFLLLAGRAGDLLGRRRVFVAGVATFTVASMAAAVAPTAGVLIAARALQGLAAAAIASMTLALIATEFPSGRPRNRALAVWGTVFGASGALGLILGGVLVTGPGWRWIFLVNVPIGVVLLIGTRWVRADQPERGGQRFDFVGAVTSTAGATLLAFTVLQTDRYGWSSAYIIGLSALTALLLSYFVLHEVRFAREPLIPLRLFRDRGLTGASVINALRGSAMFAMFYFATLYQQQVLHRSALATSLAYLPLTAVTVAAAVSAPILVRMLGSRWVVAVGAAFAVAGAWWFTGMSSVGDVVIDVILPSTVLSLGLGMMIVPVTTAGLSRLSPADSGVGSGLLNVSLQLGGAVGLAVLSSAATHTTNTRLADRPDEAAEALTRGFAAGFGVAAALMVGAALAALVFLRDDDRGPRGR
ncbi:MFS transporter [Nocardia altamirensis]|uniref:MFS transporter n=1 Tax=Nocardia altamirensis TaxID=472158 RepID=UPI000A00A07D|nr:MFS transporter [Nocardia altamirensis]